MGGVLNITEKMNLDTVCGTEQNLITDDGDDDPQTVS